jgi:GTP:adenosylcobinamide-phosphate guanylyltransferase
VKYTAVVLAGSRPGPDPFAAQFGVETKALIPIAGEPMVRRPVAALLASGRVGDVIVLAQSSAAVAAAIPTDPRVRVRESQGSIAATILQLCANADTEWPLLVTTADHALLDTPTIDEFLGAAKGADIAIGMVERANLLRRLPQSRRTWLKFRGGAFTGANLFVLRSPQVARAVEIWRSVEQDRKKAWRIISLLGPITLAMTALRLLGVDEVLSSLSDRLGLSIKAVKLTSPLAGVDVDKPDDHALAEAILAGRA